MIRLHIIAEGQTETNFAQKVLAPHLAGFNIIVDARAVMTSKDRRTSQKRSGGITSYGKAKNDIMAWLKEDAGAESRFTTMFDLYGLPKTFPEYDNTPRSADPYERIKILEAALASKINDPQGRFIPYIQLHEFEALIFADPRQLYWNYLEYATPIRNLSAMVEGQNPELLNDGPATAPSKRILKEIPAYDKVTAGVAVAEKIGLPTLREKCRHFAEWVSRLESLAGTNP
ncbi:MAG: DUF4276 family protein [Deltaproteobacteria bacterium]|jgi:hypothetical protein|nr:DUF4276 family protein [Deltaproteobacteria bacterium]